MNKLYETIENEKIIFKNDYINETTKSICIKLPNNKYAIVLDNKKIESTAEENCTLAEELRTLLLSCPLFSLIL